MTKVVLRLEQQLADLRSDEISFDFTVENQGETPLGLRSITPRIPQGARLIEIMEPSFEAIKLKHTKLCDSLTQILQDYLLVTCNEIKERYIQVQKETINAVIGSPLWSPFRWYIRLFSGQMTSALRESRERWSAYNIKLETYAQAKAAFDRWIAIAAKENIAFKELFEEKLRQLEVIEQQMGPDVASSSLATIEPKSFFAMTYVLRFARGMLDSRKYNILIEASYVEGGQAQPSNSAATASIIISPRPSVLTTIAICASVLGVILRHAMDLSNSTAQVTGMLDQQHMALFGIHSVGAIVLALVFFNVYEFTEMGKKLTIGIGWRSALLIGVLCGILGDKLLAALKALLGA